MTSLWVNFERTVATSSDTSVQIFNLDWKISMIIRRILWHKNEMKMSYLTYSLLQDDAVATKSLSLHIFSKSPPTLISRKMSLVSSSKSVLKSRQIFKPPETSCDKTLLFVEKRPIYFTAERWNWKKQFSILLSVQWWQNPTSWNIPFENELPLKAF